MRIMIGLFFKIVLMFSLIAILVYPGVVLVKKIQLKQKMQKVEAL